MITRFNSYPMVDLIAYDFGSRCALAATVDISRSNGPINVTGFVALPQVAMADTAPSLAVDGLFTMTAFVTRHALTPAERCGAALAAAYGPQFEAEQASVAKLVEHAKAVLNGAGAGSAEAPLQASAIEQTVKSRTRARLLMKKPQFLGLVKSADHTVIVLGDPHAGVRWAAQYRNLGPSRWAFEGGTDAGFTLMQKDSPDA
ncbi:hypothetical protein NF700_06920 [Sphingomonadaceae bacterium OTU29MARTA1]|nr:hypothetical protein NF700_06920 [Sphingomonadaceae bacterium OTU29MARTA1]